MQFKKILPQFWGLNLTLVSIKNSIKAHADCYVIIRCPPSAVHTWLPDNVGGIQTKLARSVKSIQLGNCKYFHVRSWRLWTHYELLPVTAIHWDISLKWWRFCSKSTWGFFHYSRDCRRWWMFTNIFFLFWTFIPRWNMWEGLPGKWKDECFTV